MRVKSLLTLSLLVIVFSCSQNKITGRRQLLLFPEQQVESMALTEYKTFLSQNKVIANKTANAAMVQRVGLRLTNAVTKYFNDKSMGNQLADYKWEYNLVESAEANAWCMPGGKIVVYTGLLPITQNEDALAFVMGHEISHALFQHGNERLSQQLGAQAVQTGLQVALANKSTATQNVFLTAFGIGSQVGVLLPFSRKHESESDKFGLFFTAMAGYNPRESIGLWQRMEQLSVGNKPPAFLSTHPSEGKRIEDLNKYMDEALSYYYQAIKK